MTPTLFNILTSMLKHKHEREDAYFVEVEREGIE